MTKEKVLVAFLQKEYQGLPAGTPLVRAEPTSAHMQARVMVGEGSYPAMYYKVFGGGDEVIYIPMFNALVGEHHPTSKEVVGPFSLDPLPKVDFDSLPKGKRAIVAFNRAWPVINVTVCIDPDQEDLEFDEASIKWPDYLIDNDANKVIKDRVILFAKTVCHE